VPDLSVRVDGAEATTFAVAPLLTFKLRRGGRGMRTPGLLVAGIGNIFFGDDAFGVEVVRLLAGRFPPDAVNVVDFGIRGFDLACALTAGHGGAILIDTLKRDGAPGTLYVLEPELPDEGAAGVVEGHGLDPVKVLRLAAAMGEVCPWLRLVGCEPLTFGSGDEPAMGLSEPVAAALPGAVRLVEELVANYLDGNHAPRNTVGEGPS
jgi:hydrogenase maturation protease